MRALLALAGAGLLLLAGGEAWRALHSDAGQIALARHLGWGDPARVTRLVGREVRRGLAAAGVPRDSVREEPAAGGRAPVRWRVGVPPAGSLLQINYAVTRTVEQAGASVLSGREQRSREGGTVVTLLVGLPGRPTHQIDLTREARPAGTAGGEPSERAPGRLALVLYGFADQPDRAQAFIRMRLPFAVALVPGAPWSAGLFRAARQAQREVVLHLPLEPVNYPQVDPGPGAVLVTMEPARITGMVRRYLDVAGPVSAVSNHMGSLATQDMQVMTAVYRELHRRGVPFVQVQPAAGSVCRSLASGAGVIYAEPDVVIDEEGRGPAPRALDATWKRALERARAHGRAIVYLRASPLVQRWLPGALAPRRLEGVSVVPLASLLRRGATM